MPDAALAIAFRCTAAAVTGELLSQIEALPRAPVAEAGPLVLRQDFDGASDTIIDVGVLTDDLSGYDPAEPFGYWDIPNAGQPLQDCLDPPGPPGADDERTLRLAVTDGVARTQMIGLEKFRRPGPLLAVPLNELQVMIDLDASDPLFLWRFARADERFHENSRVQSWSVLDLYSIYRGHDYSFYLDDDRPRRAGRGRRGYPRPGPGPGAARWRSWGAAGPARRPGTDAWTRSPSWRSPGLPGRRRPAAGPG